jgi:mRNA-degrading endonuclease RelE of RelBE toxin-antitoxin system
MPAAFRVLTTPAFEREFRRVWHAEPKLPQAFDELIGILQQDPHNRTGRHKIKKLTGVKLGEGQWRIRWRDYRLRYDIIGRDVVLHTFRHRREVY